MPRSWSDLRKVIADQKSQLAEAQAEVELLTAQNGALRNIAAGEFEKADSAWKERAEKAEAALAEALAQQDALIGAAYKVAASTGYITCAETRHVTLGDSVSEKIIGLSPATAREALAAIVRALDEARAELAALKGAMVKPLVEALEVAGDYLDACKVNGLPDLGDASRMPFLADVIEQIDLALRGGRPRILPTLPLPPEEQEG